MNVRRHKLSEERAITTTDAFGITCERTGTTAHLAVTGELDMASTPQLREYLRAELGDDSEIVVLDLGRASFIDSSGLHVLIEATARYDGRLRVIPNHGLLRLLDLTGLSEHVPIIESRSDFPDGNGR